MYKETCHKHSNCFVTVFWPTLLKDIEDIRWLHRNMKFLFDVEKYFKSEHGEKVKYFNMGGEVIWTLGQPFQKI